jgi:hypothetical protein
MTHNKSPFEFSSADASAVNSKQREDSDASGAILGVYDKPTTFRGDADLHSNDDLEESNLAVQTLSRTARDHFISVAESLKCGNVVDSESHLYACRDCIEDIWQHARVRSQPFHDLLALVEVGVRSKEISEFEPVHLDILRIAFGKLCKPFLDYEDIEESIESCAEYELDLAAPLKLKGKEPFRITIEPVK